MWNVSHLVHAWMCWEPQLFSCMNELVGQTSGNNWVIAATSCILYGRQSIDQIHKSHNAPVTYPQELITVISSWHPAMHHSEQKCAHFCSEWCIVGYGTGALWDLWKWSVTRKWQPRVPPLTAKSVSVTAFLFDTWHIHFLLPCEESTDQLIIHAITGHLIDPWEVQM